ncbi:MAG: dihydroorotase [Abditibacteriales bacterium]|nr:dihydroorotase [Abditibacteriales bacterium]MDW8364663.1 dihydroorotase [Abditibacteriales bacterium]
MSELLIYNGHVIDPANNIDDTLDVLVRDGVIAQVGKGLKSRNGQKIDARGLVVAPGFIDLHTHLRVPGQEYKEDIASGTRAAVRGGFTTICCMPNTTPPIHSPEIVRAIIEQTAQEGFCRVLPVAAVSVDLQHEVLTEFALLKEAGAVAVSDDAFPVQSAGFMRRVMEYAAMLDMVVMTHPEDKSLSEGGAMNEGAVSALLGLRGMPREAEEIHIARNIMLAAKTGCRLHVLHVSTAYGVALVRRAKAEGVRVTAEGCPHHFTLTDEAVIGYDTNTKMNPPLRTQADVEAVVAGLQDGTLDAIATDHAPHAAHEKEVEYDNAPFGIIGLETAFGLTMRQLVRTGKMSLRDALACLTAKPARVLGLDAGTLSVGAPADITIFDPDAEWVVDVSQLASKSKNTPFGGWTMVGKVMETIVAGQARG